MIRMPQMFAQTLSSFDSFFPLMHHNLLHILSLSLSLSLFMLGIVSQCTAKKIR